MVTPFGELFALGEDRRCNSRKCPALGSEEGSSQAVEMGNVLWFPMPSHFSRSVSNDLSEMDSVAMEGLTEMG